MILELRSIYKTYSQGKLDVPVLKNVSLSVDEGEYVAIMGPSGSGKTTLMNIIGCLDSPTSGEYLLEGEDLSQQNDAKLSAVRLHSIGFVFQSFYLLSRQTAVDNVALPLLYAGVRRSERLETAKRALERVGLGDRMDFKPTQLSGGQCQRVAIARAIVNNPKILLADEPTGALDTKSGEQVMEIFQKLNNEGVTIVMITHEPEIAAHAQRILHIRDGRLVDEHGNFLAPEELPDTEEATEPLTEDLPPVRELLAEPLAAQEVTEETEPEEPEIELPVAEETESEEPEIELPVVEEAEPEEPEIELPVAEKAEPEEPEIELPVAEETEPEKPEIELPVAEETEPEEPEIELPVVEETEPEIELPVVEETEPEIELPVAEKAEPEEPEQSADTFLDAEIAALLDGAAGDEEDEEELDITAIPVELPEPAPLVARPVKKGAPEQMAFDIWAPKEEEPKEEEPEEVPFDTAFDAVEPYEPEEEPPQGRFGAPLRLDVDLASVFAAKPGESSPEEPEQPEPKQAGPEQPELEQPALERPESEPEGGFHRPVKIELNGLGLDKPLAPREDDQ